MEKSRDIIFSVGLKYLVYCYILSTRAATTVRVFCETLMSSIGCVHPLSIVPFAKLIPIFNYNREHLLCLSYHSCSGLLRGKVR